MKKLVFLLCTVLMAVSTSAQVQPRLVLPVGHSSLINAVTFSPDEKYLATASSDYTAKIWELSTGRELLDLRGHTGRLNDISFSNDGKYIVTASGDMEAGISPGEFTAKIWDMKTGNLIHDLIGHNSIVYTAKFCNDQKNVITASIDGDIKIWDVATGKQLYNFSKFESAIIRPDCNLFLTYDDSTTKIWSVSNGKEIKKISNVESAIIKPDCDFFITYHDSVIKIRDLEKGLVSLNINLKKAIKSATFSIDRKFVVAISYDDSVKIYDANTGKETKINYDKPTWISTDFISQNNVYIFSQNYISDGKWFNKCIVQEVSTGIKLNELNILGSISSATISPNGRYVVITGYEDSTNLIWDIRTNQKTFSFFGPTQYISSDIFSSDKRTILTSSYKESQIWGLTNGVIKNTIKDNETVCRAFSNDGKYLVGGSYNSTVKIWDVRSGQLIRSMNGHKGKVINVTFSKDDKYICSASIDSTVRVWDASNGNLIRELNWHPSSEFDEISFSSDCKYIVTTDDKGYTIRIWDVFKGQLIHSFKQKKYVYKVKFSSDNKYLITACGDSTANIIEINTGKNMQTFYGHKGDVNYANFSENDENVVTVAFDTTSVIFWNKSTGKQIKAFNGLRNNTFESIRISRDLKYIISTDDFNHKTILWDATTGKQLYTRLQLDGGNWLVYDEDHHFDGSPGARDLLYFVCGLEVVELSQMKDALYVPGLAEKIMSGQPIHYKKLSELDICGTLPLIDTISKNDKGYHYKITPRKYPLERLELKINNKNVLTIQPERLTKHGNTFYLDLSEQEVSRHFISGQPNEVKLIGVVKDGNTEITTRGVIVTSNEASGKSANPPNLYAVMVGINDYKDDLLRLNFPSKDAISLGKSVEQSAKKLLGDAHVFVYNINSDFKNNQVNVISTPEKEGVRQVLEAIGKKSKPEDIVMIFFAGHGVMQGATDKKFTFLTAEASKDNLVGISTNDLKSWLSPEGPNKMLANKCILIFDACNSGQATQEMAALARSDDESNRIRQVEDLKDKSGLFILAASAPNQSAYELPQYQQGLLTYCLLNTLKNNPNILDDNKYLNVQKWFLQTEELLKNTMENLGLKQSAQPFGTANIKIGLVDDGVKNAIQLAKEKPTVLCISAENTNTDEDGLRLKDKLNAKLMEVTTRGIDAPIMYIDKETNNANAIKLKYEMESGKIKCNVSILKNQKRYFQGSVEGKESSLDGMIDLIIGMVEKNIQ